jgi:hypothetical protein
MTKFSTVAAILDRTHIDLSEYRAISESELRTLPPGTPIVRQHNGRWYAETLIKVNRVNAVVRSETGELAGINCTAPIAAIKGAKR